MSCFWTGLCAKVPALKKHGARDVRKALQSVNVRTKTVTWNGKPLSPSVQEENWRWVKEYDRPWNDGHDTSSCDPFLALVCEAFTLNIDFTFAGASCQFRHPKATSTVVFKSSTTHFT